MRKQQIIPNEQDNFWPFDHGHAICFLQKGRRETINYISLLQMQIIEILQML